MTEVVKSTTQADRSPDHLAEDLAGTGRHLSTRELRTWTRFLDAGRLLEEILSQHVTRDHGMTHSDYEVLVRLDGANGSMRMSLLARQVVSSAQKLTHTANRLESRGWIRREPAAEDGRGLVAILTDDGLEALGRASAKHAQLIKRFLLDHLTWVEQELVAELMDRVAGHMRIHRDDRPCDLCRDDLDRPG